MAYTGLDAYKNNQDNYTIDKSRKLRVGIIGAGWIASAHIQEYLRMPDIELVGIADLIDGKVPRPRSQSSGLASEIDGVRAVDHSSLEFFEITGRSQKFEFKHYLLRASTICLAFAPN